MDISGLRAEAIARRVRDIFAGGNDANFIIRGNVYPALQVSQYYRHKNHCVEWRYGGCINLWISRCVSELTVDIRARSDVSRCIDAVSRRNILCFRLRGTGQAAINHLWEAVRYFCERGYVMEHNVSGPMGLLVFSVVLRKQHDDLSDMAVDD